MSTSQRHRRGPLRLVVAASVIVTAAACALAPTRASNGSVTALGEGDGKTSWTATIGRGWATAPVVADGVAVIRSYDSCGSGTATLVALDVATGHRRWSTSVSYVQEAPRIKAAVADGVVLAAGGGRLRALDLQTGKLRWEVATTADGAVAAGFGEAVVLSVAFGEVPPHAEAYDLATGEKRWDRSRPAGQVFDLFTTAHGFVIDQQVAGNAPHRALRQIDPGSGAERWQSDLGWGEHINSARVGSRALTLTLGSATVSVLDEATGAEMWRLSDSFPGMNTEAAPGVGAHTADLVFAQLGNDVVALDLATRAERWRIGGVRLVGPAGDVVLVQANGLVARHGPDGTVAWESSGTGSQWVSADGIVVGTTPGNSAHCGDS